MDRRRVEEREERGSERGIGEGWSLQLGGLTGGGRLPDGDKKGRRGGEGHCCGEPWRWIGMGSIDQ